MKEFITRAIEVDEENAGEETVYEFSVDGVMCTASQPTPGQLGVFTAMISDVNGWQTQAAGIINFFFGLLDAESKSYLAQRLLDRKDSFEIDDVRDIMFYLMEQWTGNPTEGPSDSFGSELADGPNSKQSSAEPVSI